MARLIIPNIPRSAVLTAYKGITGTVNGVSTVFVCDHFIYKAGTGDSVLVAYAKDASSYAYSVKVDGVTYSGTIQHSALMSFVYDRTQADVDYAKRIGAKNRAETSEDLKGTLNSSDINRNVTNITSFCNIYGIDQQTPTTVPEFPNKDTVFDKMNEDLEDISYDGYVCHGTVFYSGAENYDSYPPFNQWYTWNDAEECLFDNYDVITTRWEYFAGRYTVEFIEDDLDIDEHNLFVYLSGQKYKADVSKVCQYVEIPAITRPNDMIGVYTFTSALNAVYAKIMEDMDTLMLESSDGYVLATNTGKVIVAKED